MHCNAYIRIYTHWFLLLKLIFITNYFVRNNKMSLIVHISRVHLL